MSFDSAFTNMTIKYVEDCYKTKVLAIFSYGSAVYKNKIPSDLDYIVINDLSAFGEDNNSIILLDSNENSIKFESQSKSEIAKHIIDNIIINKKEN